MSEYTPSVEEARECYASSGDGLDFKRRYTERLAEHDRMIAEAEGVAAEKAWAEGHAAGRDYQGDGWNSDAHDPEEDNPYRRSEP